MTVRWGGMVKRNSSAFVTAASSAWVEESAVANLAFHGIPMVGLKYAAVAEQVLLISDPSTPEGVLCISLQCGSPGWLSAQRLGTISFVAIPGYVYGNELVLAARVPVVGSAKWAWSSSQAATHAR